jgi:hypothetical protein
MLSTKTRRHSPRGTISIMNQPTCQVPERNPDGGLSHSFITLDSEMVWHQMNEAEQIRTFVKLSIASVRGLT